jgi:hypothetical protein
MRFWQGAADWAASALVVLIMVAALFLLVLAAIILGTAISVALTG